MPAFFIKQLLWTFNFHNPQILYMNKFYVKLFKKSTCLLLPDNKNFVTNGNTPSSLDCQECQHPIEDSVTIAVLGFWWCVCFSFFSWSSVFITLIYCMLAKNSERTNQWIIILIICIYITDNMVWFILYLNLWNMNT
jgi:hypothetical protein